MTQKSHIPHRSPNPKRTQVSATCLLLVAVASTSTRTLADEPPLNRGESRWGLGAAVEIQRKAYRGVGNDTQAIPLIYFENAWVRVLGPGLDLKLPSAGPVSFRMKARYDLDGYEPSDSALLEGMGEREGGVWVGAEAVWHLPHLNLSAELVADASDKSDGQQFRLQVDRRFLLGSFNLTPRLAAIHLDRKYVGYYHGVDASEAAPGRPPYPGRSTFNLEIGLRVDHALSRQHSVYLDLRSTRLGDGIKDSPLIERSSTSGMRVGYLYRF